MARKRDRSKRKSYHKGHRVKYAHGGRPSRRDYDSGDAYQVALEQWRSDPAHQGKSKAPVQPAVSTPVTPPTYAPVTTPSPPRTTLGPDNLKGKRGGGPDRPVASPVSDDRDAADSGAFEDPSKPVIAPPITPKKEIEPPVSNERDAKDSGSYSTVYPTTPAPSTFPDKSSSTPPTALFLNIPPDLNAYVIDAGLTLPSEGTIETAENFTALKDFIVNGIPDKGKGLDFLIDILSNPLESGLKFLFKTTPKLIGASLRDITNLAKNIGVGSSEYEAKIKEIVTRFQDAGITKEEILASAAKALAAEESSGKSGTQGKSGKYGTESSAGGNARGYVPVPEVGAYDVGSALNTLYGGSDGTVGMGARGDSWRSEDGGNYFDTTYGDNVEGVPQSPDAAKKWANKRREIAGFDTDIDGNLLPIGMKHYREAQRAMNNLGRQPNAEETQNWLYANYPEAYKATLREQGIDTTDFVFTPFGADNPIPTQTQTETATEEDDVADDTTNEEGGSTVPDNNSRQVAEDIIAGKAQGPQIPVPKQVQVGADATTMQMGAVDTVAAPTMTAPELQASQAQQAAQAQDVTKVSGEDLIKQYRSNPDLPQYFIGGEAPRYNSQTGNIEQGGVETRFRSWTPQQFAQEFNLKAEGMAAAQMQAAQVTPQEQISGETGAIGDDSIAKAAQVDRVAPISGADVTIPEGALAERVIGTLSPNATAIAAQAAGTTLSKVTRAKRQLRNSGMSEEAITALGNDPEDLEDRLMDLTEEERGVIGDLPEEALVSNQLDSLLKGMENGDIPTWANPAVAAVEQMLAQRGLSASTVGRDNLFNAIIQSAVPIAQANAQAIQASVAQTRDIESRTDLFNAQARQQTALQNAGNVFQMDMAQFSADQQTTLSNSKFMQTVGLTEATNDQQSVIQNAVLLSQTNLAEADFYQKTQAQNAQAFLQMDLTNLNNKQQANVLTAQMRQQTMLSNQAATNAASQFNATSENQTQQFMTSLAAQISTTNAQQENAMKQFNVQQNNANNAIRFQTEADLEKANTALKVDVDKTNAQLSFSRDQWNKQNAQAVEQSNVAWRRQVNTANTAADNQVAMQNAMNAFNLNSQSLSFLWQELRDQADQKFKASENFQNREVQLLATAMANEGDAGKTYDNLLTDLIKSLALRS
jgi:hypothetical protein